MFLVALLIISFGSCHKENIKEVIDLPIEVLEDKDASLPIAIEELKNWYETTLQAEKTVTSFSPDSSYILANATPAWSKSVSGKSTKGDNFVITPINLATDNSVIKLLSYRQPNGQILGKLVAYLPEKEYHKKTNGKYKTKDFTGAVIYTNLAGKYEYGFNLKNGKYDGNASAKRSNGNPTTTLTARCYTESYTLCVSEYNPYAFTSSGCMFFIEVTTQYCGFNTSQYDPNMYSTPGGMGGRGGGGGSSWSDNQPSNIFSTQQLQSIKQQYLSANMEDAYDNMQYNQDLLQAATEFLDLKGWDYINKAAVTEMSHSSADAKVLAQYFFRLYSDNNFYTIARLKGIRNVYDKINSNTSTLTEQQKVERLNNYVNITNALLTELTQLAQENAASISSSGDMNILMKIFGKVLGKKIGKVIPFVGTGLGLDAAWTAYRLGNYGEAAWELAGVAMDFLPVGIVLETGWTMVDVAYDAFKAFKPIAKISSYCTGSFANVFTSLFNIIDDFNLFDKISDISKTSNSVTNISVNLSQSGKSIDNFLDNLANALGQSWIPHPSGAGKAIELGGDNQIFFYTRSSTGNPGLQFKFNGTIVFKIDFN